MALATKALTALNQEIVIDDPTEYNGGLAVQYGTKSSTGGASSGTIVVEGTLNGTDWDDIKMTRPSTDTQTNTISSAGIWMANIVGFDKVKVRMSVAGDVVVSLNVAMG